MSLHFLCRDHAVKTYVIKAFYKYQISELILLHGDPDDEFHLKLQEFIFHGHILTCW